MSNAWQGIASAGFIASPFGDIPMNFVMLMGGVTNPARCAAWLKNPDSVTPALNTFLYTPPCHPADPVLMNGIFIVIGVLLFASWLIPNLKSMVTSH